MALLKKYPVLSRACIFRQALSLERLADEDGELARRFMLLGVFPAGFGAAAAAAIWQTEPRIARDALDALAEWSLVQVEAVGRYRLHDLVRDLAVGRAEPAAVDDIQAQHAMHYGAVLTRANELGSYRVSGWSAEG
jgi:hypothetical protein